MFQVVIIEDEQYAKDQLLQALQEIQMPVQVQAALGSVKEAVDYFASHAPSPDLIFSDVQLRDGLSFSVFQEVNIQAPVIFITGYDEFMMSAFEHNGIDYLLKPVDARDLSKAIHKYRMLRQHFVNHQQGLQPFLQGFERHTRSRIMVRKGLENVPLKLSDVVLFYTEHKVVYALDRDGKKYFCDQTLSELDLDLDRRQFFRANRQYIINIDFIQSYKTLDKVKVQVEVVQPNQKHIIVISQETAPLFRRWIMEA